MGLCGGTVDIRKREQAHAVQSSNVTEPKASGRPGLKSVTFRSTHARSRRSNPLSHELVYTSDNDSEIRISSLFHTWYSVSLILICFITIRGYTSRR